MNMGTSTTVAMSMGTTTATAAAATTSAMSMSMGGECQISMLWNWYTVDSCFIAKSWQIKSEGMFAGSCIGVILLVMSLEFLRRGSKEYDRYILRQAQRKQEQASQNYTSGTYSDGNKVYINVNAAASQDVSFRPNVFQQLIRALFHMVQFAVAYFIMLLAMYYNGYIIISIIIGAFLGAFVFSWESVSLRSEEKQEATLCCG